MKHLTSTKKSAFTLIELLVVIAIIAILAAILFPVFAQAREKARAITCVSNMKQIGLAIIQYQQDYDEYLNPANYQVPGGSGTVEFRWYQIVNPYIKNGTVIQTGPNAGHLNGAGGVWHCPSFPSAQDANYGLADHIFPGPGLPTYTHGELDSPTLNSAALSTPGDTIMCLEKGQANAGAPQLGPGGSSWPVFGEHEGFWTDQVGNPPGSNVDGTDNSVVSSWSQTNCDMPLNAGCTVVQCGDYGQCGMHPRYRHNNSCSCLFVDGHVKAMGEGKISWVKNIYDKNAWQNWCGGNQGTQAGECPPW